MAKPLGFMYALGLNGLPTEIEVRGMRYVLEKEQKHDFWAGTGFYRRDLASVDTSSTGDGLPPRVVAKFNRQTSFLGIPLRWIGRWLRNRERRAYAKLQDVPGIPALLGDVSDTGFVHTYIEGSPLMKGLALADDFFPKLIALIDTLHARGIAYVDTNKPQNILVGDDSLPYLIDFQISVDADAWWPRWLGRRVLEVFYRADVYHVLKQKRRFRPDQLTEPERVRLERRGVLLRLHRAISKPYFWIRRPLMRWLERSGRAQKRGSD